MHLYEHIGRITVEEDTICTICILPKSRTVGVLGRNFFGATGVMAKFRAMEFLSNPTVRRYLTLILSVLNPTRFVL